MLPFGGNVSEALVVLTATVAASNNQWFSNPSVTSLFDRVFNVVGSDPCYIGACTGSDRIVLTPKQARSSLLSYLRQMTSKSKQHIKLLHTLKKK